MMLLGLFAVEIGRSYEPLTAMAISAVFILLQKPYAFLSCSFLLSYSAVLGVFLTYPALRSILPNSPLQERGRRRKMQASIFMFGKTWFILASQYFYPDYDTTSAFILFL